MLKGFGEVHRAAEGSPVRSSVGINLVMGVARAEGSRLWVRSTGGNDSGWVDSTITIRLSEAIPYLSAMIARDSANWDLYLRRAEAEHALNQREAATVDYTTAISLHPTEAFLYLRRGRHYNTVHECDKELADFEQAIARTPTVVLKEAVMSCPGGHGTSSTAGCAAGQVARSLSAIRWAAQTSLRPKRGRPLWNPLSLSANSSDS
jgi:tetratricopeptide (TPR) repeat protein